MRLIINVAALAAMAAVPSIAQALELAVKLEMHGNFEVKATITNPTDEDVKVLKTGSILDSAPVQKAQVSYEGKFANATARVYRRTPDLGLASVHFFNTF